MKSSEYQIPPQPEEPKRFRLVVQREERMRVGSGERTAGTRWVHVGPATPDNVAAWAACNRPEWLEHRDMVQAKTQIDRLVTAIEMLLSDVYACPECNETCEYPQCREWREARENARNVLRLVKEEGP